ncbi:L-serine ammonia-lyase, partial [Halomonas sp. BM-2019]|uniref:L-serine ammonia-lyase n=1 Tax=Halomonas sp. BM-2019 TaxID=2811227 RepID=UPI001B3C4811
MSISVFDLFKIGIGPSSSHTVGPMRAAHDFIGELKERALLERVAHLEVQLFGSLSATGIGHGTDRAVIMGLMGERPDHIDPALIGPCIEEVRESETLRLDSRHSVPFLWARDLQLLEESLPHHPNAMRLIAHGHGGELYRNTYYSVGGGFVIDEAQAARGELDTDATALPYDFQTGDELLRLCRENGLRISELMLENEKAWRSEAEIREGLLTIWAAMQACVRQGMEAEGVLPGGLNVKRRAKALYQRMLASKDDHSLIASTMSAMDWVNLYALAVNEENAAGGRMVTAPTNGAAGIIPAVLHYYMQFQPGAGERDVVDFLLAAGAVGILCKKNASISGAEVGCQGEVGSAC